MTIVKNPRTLAGHRRQLAILRGQWQPYTPASQVRDHVRAVLASTGMPQKRLALAAGVSPNFLVRLMNGTSERVRTLAASRVLAVTPAAAAAWAGAGTVGATGSMRRLQALGYAGWSPEALARETGLSSTAVAWIRDGRRSMVNVVNRGKITAVYERLWNVKPPQDTMGQRRAVTTARQLAAEGRWVPGAAWDDIDDPACKPQGVRGSRPRLQAAG